jgi:hypothetical protein
MKAALFVWFFLTIGVGTNAQSHDFVLLKKRNKTIQRLFVGQYFTAAIDGAGPYPCLVKDVFKDSLRLMSYSLLNTGTEYGGSYIDTVGRFYFTVPYKSITALYTNKNKNFDLRGSGGTLMAAGGLGLIITAVNSADVSFAVGSLVLSGLGYLLAKKSSGEQKIGKKYKLVYVKVDG